MSATERLRELLDERGMKFWDMGIRGVWFGINADGSDHQYEAYDQIDGFISIEAFDLTPEQAIAATVGTTERTTTRHGKYKTKYGRKVPLCECCGYSIGDGRWHYCPSCGAKVVDE